MAMANGRASRHFLTLEEKISVIRYAEANPSQTFRRIACVYKVGKTQISGIIKNKEALLTNWDSNTTPKDSKRMRSNFPYAEVNEDVYKWYTLAIQANVPVNGPMIKEEALKIAKLHGYTDFKASEGWLTRMKKRHDLKYFSVTGEPKDVREPRVVSEPTHTDEPLVVGKPDVGEPMITSWSEGLQDIISGYSLRDIYNMGETGVFWRAIPDKSLPEKSKLCQDGAHAEMRLTIALFVNAFGEKEVPIVIGKSTNPRCFEQLPDDQRAYPHGCRYFSNSKAWMTSVILEQILKTLNSKLVIQQRHVILLMDNAPCHPPHLAYKYSNIRIVLLRKNTTLQPLDAGIINNLKVKYKKLLLGYVVSRIGPHTCAADVVNSVDVLLALKWIKQAWSEVPATTIAKCFKQCGIIEEMSFESEFEGDEPFSNDDKSAIHDAIVTQQLMNELCSGESLDAYISADSDLSVHELVSQTDHSGPVFSEELRNLATCTKSEEIQDEVSSDQYRGDYDPEPGEPTIKTTRQALECTDQLMAFALAHNCCNSVQHLGPIIEELEKRIISEKIVT